MNLLHFAELGFGHAQLQEWLNVYETKNPLLKILKRPNLKGITLAKFAREIEIWERDGQGNPVKDSDGNQKTRNLSGEVKIRIKSNQPIIELETGTWKAVLSSSKEKEDKIIKVDAEIIKSLNEMLKTLGKKEVSVDMGNIVGIGGQATIIGKGIEFEGENGKQTINACLKFEEYGEWEREKTEKKNGKYGSDRGVKVNRKWMETGRVYGRGYLRHLWESTEFRCGSFVNYPNVIKMLDFGITKTIFGDFFFCLG